IPEEKQEELISTLHLIAQLSHKGSLSTFAVEQARSEVKEMFESQKADEIEETLEYLNATLNTFTPKQLQNLYTEWYRPDIMELTVTGAVDSQNLEEVLHQLFSDLKTPEMPSPYREGIPLIEKHTVPTVNPESDLTEPLSNVNSDEYVVIEGKIFMNTPSLMDTRFWGKAFGIIAIILSLVVFTLTIWNTPPVAMVALLPAAIGIFMAFQPYLNDPEVIREKRAEDMQYGFKHAYVKGRSHLTLTPYERRNMFIKENSIQANRNPRKFSEFCIADLTDIFDIHDAVFAEMLYPHELGDLHMVKEDFILRRNNVSMAKKILEQELNILLSPHQFLRDVALDDARAQYDENPAVVLFRELKEEWNRAVYAIWVEYDEGLLTAKEREEYLQEVSEYYEALLSDPELLAGVEKAKDQLTHKQNVALVDYEAKVIQCKLLIDYDNRMAEIEAGKWALYCHHNLIFIDYMASLPLGDPNFVDFIDLRR
nr:hypothetical protein [Chlamydiota bacterium]